MALDPPGLRRGLLSGIQREGKEMNRALSASGRRTLLRGILCLRIAKRAMVEAQAEAEAASDYVLGGTIRHYVEQVGDVIDSHDHAGKYAEIVEADGTVLRWDPAMKRYRLT